MELTALQHTTDFELKKNVHAVHSASEMTLIQRKMANILLFNAYNELPTQETHTIAITKLSKLMCYESKDSKYLKEALLGLVSTVVTWGVLDEKNNEDVWVASAMLADASISKSICKYSYSPRMRQLLFHPAMYARVNILHQSKFKSGYGLALYENCIRYKNLKYTPWMSLETFRKLMGIPENTYLIFRDLKRRVLDTAVKEVNNITSILILPELAKQGRAVHRIRFNISPKIKQEEKIEEQNDDLISKLQNSFHLLKDERESLMEKYGEEYITEKINIIESSPNFKDGKIKNLAGYLKTALEKNFQLPSLCKNIPPKKESVSRENNKITNEEKNQYERLIGKEIIETFANLEENIKSEISESFKIWLNKGVFWKNT